MPTLEEPINVFDLPNLRHRPTYQELLQALQSLEIKPTLWSRSATRSSGGSQEAAISRYLMAIVSSMFEWFDESGEGDAMERREILWNLASKRVAERCGRSAMGEMTRTWVIPASDKLPELKFEIREPPLTGDNLGLKTWGTAYAIAKRLEDFSTRYFSDLLDVPREFLTINPGDYSGVSRTSVLELGAGTGLVGIAAAAIWGTNVILTDLKEIQDNLDFNIQNNTTVVEPMGGTIFGDILDWKNSDEGLASCSTKEFDIIIAADSLYDDEHPQLVADMIQKYLRADSKSRAFVAVPMRDEKTRDMTAKLKEAMEHNRFSLFHDGWEICRDDWEGSSEDEEVKCWWAIFGLDVEQDCH